MNENRQPILSPDPRPIITAPASASIRSASRRPPSRAGADTVAAHDLVSKPLPLGALDRRIAIVGTSGSGKTYAAKGFVEQLLDCGARVTIVDPLGVWWGLRASADGTAPGYPVIVFGGKHADVPITAEMGAALGHLVATQPLVSIVDLSTLRGSTARRRFMAAFCQTLYETNEEPHQLILDEADLWAPQRPIKGWESLLGDIEEIVRRGRVRGFIPWLITQRPAVLHKDVLSQADILIAMMLTSSQDRDAIGGWIEGQADRQEGKRILADLPQLQTGEGYVWAPGYGILERVAFPVIRTFDSSRTPQRGEHIVTPRTLAEVDLTAITAALAAPDPHHHEKPPQPDRRRDTDLERQIAAAQIRIVALEQENRDLRSRLAGIASLVAGTPVQPPPDHQPPPHQHPPLTNLKPRRSPPAAVTPETAPSDQKLHPAARKLLAAAAQHAPAQFTWSQLATLAGLTPSGGHFNAGRKDLRAFGYIAEDNGLVTPTPEGIKLAGDVPPAPTTPAERLALWCGRLPSPAPEMLRTLAAQGERYIDANQLAQTIGKKPTGGHWNSGIAMLRNNGLIETDGRRRYRCIALFRE